MRGAGRVVFAAILLMIVGTVNIIYGIGALDDARILVNETRFVLDDLNTLGWVLIILGVIQLTAGFSLMAGNTYGRVIGISRRQPRRARGPVLDRRDQPVVVALRVRAVRVDRVRHSRLRRGREGAWRSLSLSRSSRDPSDKGPAIAGPFFWECMVGAKIKYVMGFPDTETV